MSTAPGRPSERTTTLRSPTDNRTAPTGSAAQQTWIEVSSTAKTRTRSTGMADDVTGRSGAAVGAQRPSTGGPPLAAVAAESQPRPGEARVHGPCAAGAA